jgi:uncharacterized membrane protein
MIPLFLGLTVSNLTALLAAIGMGYYAAGHAGAHAGSARGWHTLAGAMTLMLCIAVHCVVFTYFIATTKWIQHAVSVKGLDDAFAAPARSFRRRAFGAALASMLMVFLTAVLGAAVDTRLAAGVWHHLLALAAFGVNLGAAGVEYVAIAGNGRLIDRILEQNPPAASENR